MKKLLLVLLFSTCFVHATDKDSAVVKISTAERIIDKYSEKAIVGFEKVVEKITPVAKAGFGMAVKLQIAEGIASLIPILFFFISIVYFSKEYNKVDTILKSDNIPRHMSADGGPLSEYNTNPKMVLSLISICVFGILSCFFTPSGIMHLMAPEWYAVKDIIGLFK